MTCAKCNTHIVTHAWVVNETIFCSPRCQRGRGPDLFAKLWDARKNDWKFDHGRRKPRAPEAR